MRHTNHVIIICTGISDALKYVPWPSLADLELVEASTGVRWQNMTFIQYDRSGSLLASIYIGTRGIE